MAECRSHLEYRHETKGGVRAVASWLPEPGPLIHTFSWTMFILVILYISDQWSLGGWEAVSPLAVVLAVPYMPFLLFLLTGLVVHELGHAAAAWIVGMRVFEIAIGTFGETLFRFRIGGVSLEVKQHSLDGFVLASHKSLHFLRVRDAVMTLGGPIASGVVCVVAFLVKQRLQLSYSSIEGFVLAFIGVTNGVRALFSLYPRMMTMGFGQIPSDGLALIKTLCLSREECLELHADYYLREGLAARDLGDSAGCLDWLERGLALYPDNVPLKTWSGVVCLEASRFERAHATFRELLDRSDLEVGEELQSCVYLVWTVVATADPKLLSEADAASQTAMKIAPEDLAARYARGALLVSLDRVEEGLELLRAAVAEDDVPVHKALGSAFIAIGLAKTHEITAARERLELARALDPQCAFLRTAERSVFCAASEAADQPAERPLELSATK